MNPLHIARNLRDDYLLLLRTTFSPRQEDLRNAFQQEIERDGFLRASRSSPWLNPTQHAEPLMMLTEETRHGSRGLQTTHSRIRPAACTGFSPVSPRSSPPAPVPRNGAFLLPHPRPLPATQGRARTEGAARLPHERPRQRPTPPLEAPRRHRRFLRAVHGRNATLWRTSPDVPEEECWTRAEFRTIRLTSFLTNYQMFEYMLLRGDGRDIFKQHRVRFIVLDEVHTYHGVLGTDVAFLRRLRSALQNSRPKQSGPTLHRHLATFHAGVEGGDPRDGVAAFFTRLTDQQTGGSPMIVEESDLPQQPVGLAWPRRLMSRGSCWRFHPR